MNLCTDSMLFELIDTEKILSVTHLSQDPNISFFHAEAEKLHSNQGSVDEIIPLHPNSSPLRSFFSEPGKTEKLGIFKC